MTLGEWITGTVELELTGADVEGTLDHLRNADIGIWDLRKHGELSCSFTLSRKHWSFVIRLCKKRGDSLKLKRKLGLAWLAGRTISRPVLLTGILCLLFLTVWLPGRVLFVSVEGNERIPQRQVLAAAEGCGIGFGASRREVRSEKMKNALLSAMPQLQWAGINTSGCTAIISVREKTTAEEQKTTGEMTSILASRDGYILSCTATSGNLLVKPGDAVRKGQTLISAYTDHGLCIRAERAEGEILAQTKRDLVAVMPSQVLIKAEKQQVKRKISLLIRKKRIFLWKDSGIWEGSCGRMYEEYYITLPGDFRLPVAVCVETYYFCRTTPAELPEDNMKASLNAFAQSCLSRSMIGGRILSTEQRIATDEGRCILTGSYVCEEMIGTVRQHQIGDTNGKNS